MRSAAGTVLQSFCRAQHIADAMACPSPILPLAGFSISLRSRPIIVGARLGESEHRDGNLGSFSSHSTRAIGMLIDGRSGDRSGSRAIAARSTGGRRSLPPQGT